MKAKQVTPVPTSCPLKVRPSGIDGAPRVFLVDSPFGSLKKVRIKKRAHKNRSLAEADAQDDIKTFNNPSRQRIHLGGVSPDPFEAAHRTPTRGVHALL
jgi:hypothetical protein